MTPLPLPERVTFTTSAGDDDLIEITGNFRDDIRTALAFEHGDCEDAGCDIAVARIEGFPLTAAYLLTGATETPVLDAVQHAYADAGAIPEEDALTDFPASERTAWFAWHEANARTCPSCNSVTYVLQEVEPEQCANCLAALPRPLEGEFVLTIELGNDAMNEPRDIAAMLRVCAEQLEALDTTSLTGSLMDANGNTVGKFEVER